MHTRPRNIKAEPIKLAFSLNTKQPINVESMKFDAVAITVGTKVLSSLE